VENGQPIILVQDFSLQEGEKIQWPDRLSVNYSVANEGPIEGISFMFMTCYGLILLFGVFGSLQTILLDRADQKELQEEIP
jgi:hypothetical protein